MVLFALIWILWIGYILVVKYGKWFSSVWLLSCCKAMVGRANPNNMLRVGNSYGKSNFQGDKERTFQSGQMLPSLNREKGNKIDMKDKSLAT